MSFLALSLLLVAAIFHAGWNMILKQTGEKYVALWWAGMLTTGLTIPLFWLGQAPRLEIWPFILLSALTEVAYMATLAYAYEMDDFSLVYPIARGAAPGFLTIWSILFLRERLTLQGIAGLVLIIGGLLVVGSSNWIARIQAQENFRVESIQKTSWKGILLALAVAFLISMYSAIDGITVQHTAATPYTIMVLGLTGPLFTPIMLRRYSWKTVRIVWRKNWQRILWITALSLLAYTLVLNAYTMAPVSYAGAIREVSIVFAAIAGWKLLGENLGQVRILGSAAIFAGILLISLI